MFVVHEQAAFEVKQLRAEAFGTRDAKKVPQAGRDPLASVPGVGFYDTNCLNPVSGACERGRPFAVLLPARRSSCTLHLGQAALVSPPRLLRPAAPAE